jgi:hypothetical protein
LHKIGGADCTFQTRGWYLRGAGSESGSPVSSMH